MSESERVINGEADFRFFQGEVTARMMTIRKTEGVSYNVAHSQAIRDIAAEWNFSEDQFRSDLGFWRNVTGAEKRRKTAAERAARERRRKKRNGNGTKSTTRGVGGGAVSVMNQTLSKMSQTLSEAISDPGFRVPVIQGNLIPKISSMKIESPRRRMIRQLVEAELKNLNLRSGDRGVIDFGGDVNAAEIGAEIVSGVSGLVVRRERDILYVDKE